MNQTIAFRLNQKQVAELMGLGKEEGQGEQVLPPLAWLLIQHESQGMSRENFAKVMGVELEEIQGLIEYTTGKQGEAAEETWQLGVVALKASVLGAQHQIATGWDEIEAMALEKLGNQLASMRTDGKAEDMLAIAKTANAAIRRGKGEGKGGTPGLALTVRPGESGGSIEMASGDLGVMTLNFSPRIKEQLANPDRIIDAVPNRGDGVGIKNLEMVRLKEARKIVEGMDKADATAASEVSQLDDKAREQAKVDERAAAFQLADLFGPDSK